MPPHPIPFPAALIDANKGRGIGLHQNRGRSVATGAKNTVGDTVIVSGRDRVSVKSIKYYNENIK